VPRASSPKAAKAAKPKDLSAYCLKLVRRSPHVAVPHYLIHCFLYYKLGTSVISDAAFDEIVSILSSNWDRIEHPHKALLDREFLKSGYHLSDYPKIAVGAAFSLLEDARMIPKGSAFWWSLAWPESEDDIKAALG